MGKRDLVIYVALKKWEEFQNKEQVFHHKYCKNARLTSINLTAVQLNQSKSPWFRELNILNLYYYWKLLK